MSYRRRSNLPWVVLIGVLVLGAGGLKNVGASAPAAAAPTSAAVAAEQAYAQQAFGNDSSEQTCLIDLWNQESGWDPSSDNTQSGAYGIAQSLGHGGSGTAAPDGENEYGPLNGMTLPASTYVAANEGNADAQIQWGEQYIHITYGDPCGAWAHEEANNWY